MQALPSYESEWQPLSVGHVDLTQRLVGILDGITGNGPQPVFAAWAVIGTFGAGKTQLLYHIFGMALSRGLLPIYVFAEDLFREVLTNGAQRQWLPGDVAALADDKLGRIRSGALAGDVDAVIKIVGPRSPDVELMLGQAVRVASAHPQRDAPIVVLVDELEQHYQTLQQRVLANERSPLREWLESRNDLKFLALAPAGMYEMGGADQTRVGRLVLPPVDPWFVRKEFLSGDAGKSNAAWWLTRGKPRHLAKAI